jgi:hypothetical protein
MTGDMTMSEHDDKVTVVESGGGGGGIIAGIVIGAVLLVVLFFIFGDRIFSGTDTKSIDVDVNLPKVDAPAKVDTPPKQ